MIAPIGGFTIAGVNGVSGRQFRLGHREGTAWVSHQLTATVIPVSSTVTLSTSHLCSGCSLQFLQWRPICQLESGSLRWKAASGTSGGGAMFGGMYAYRTSPSSTWGAISNPLTGGRSCPPGFTASTVFVVSPHDDNPSTLVFCWRHS